MPIKQSILHGRASLQQFSMTLGIALTAAFSALCPQSGYSAQDMLSSVADGKPWAFVVPGKDREAILTLNGDGTAEMKIGIRTAHPHWREIPGGLCLTIIASRPERCVTLKEAKYGYDAFQGNVLSFQLHR